MSRLTPSYARYLIRNNFVLSSEDWKEIESFKPDEMIQAILHSDMPLTGSELQLLHEYASEKTGKDFDEDITKSDTWDETIADKYAQWIGNSHYTYKPEATGIDANINPNEEHIGPMAQQIEKVNPACIETTPEGVKTVDTSRLALMNAGAIGELGRDMSKLEDVVMKMAAKMGVA